MLQEAFEIFQRAGMPEYLREETGGNDLPENLRHVLKENKLFLMQKDFKRRNKLEIPGDLFAILEEQQSSGEQYGIIFVQLPEETGMPVQLSHIVRPQTDDGGNRVAHGRFV